MSDSGKGADPTTQANTMRELERRLHEQAEHNAELDAEVRYLQQELKVRNEFVKDLEAELASLHELAGRQQEAVAEYSAYRHRVSHRTVDGVITRIQRVPWLYSPMRKMGRAFMARRSPSTPAELPPSIRGPEVGADPLGPRAPTSTETP